DSGADLAPPRQIDRALRFEVGEIIVERAEGFAARVGQVGDAFLGSTLHGGGLLRVNRGLAAGGQRSKRERRRSYSPGRLWTWRTTAVTCDESYVSYHR